MTDEERTLSTPHPPSGLYQGGGHGNAPHPRDEIILAPFNGGGTPGGAARSSPRGPDHRQRLHVRSEYGSARSARKRVDSVAITRCLEGSRAHLRVHCLSFISALRGGFLRLSAGGRRRGCKNQRLQNRCFTSCAGCQTTTGEFIREPIHVRLHSERQGPITRRNLCAR